MTERIAVTVTCDICGVIEHGTILYAMGCSWEERKTYYGGKYSVKHVCPACQEKEATAWRPAVDYKAITISVLKCLGGKEVFAIECIEDAWKNAEEAAE